ncbi:MAG TPA: MFS transporter, partial [Stellaceae bacterium]
MGSATFFDAFDALSLAFVLPILIGLWHLSAVEIGFLIAASYVGQLAGALLFSRLAEQYGRIRGAAAAIAIMSVMSLGCALAGNFPVLFLCRLVQGIGVGGEMPVAATYISELSRARGRGRFFLLYEMIFPVGLMATGQIGTLLVPLLGWKIMFLIGGIPGLIICVLVMRLPESPRWLMSRGRLAEAEAIVRQVEASTPRRLPADPAGPAPSAGPRPTLAEPQRSRWSELLSPFYRQRSLIVWTLWASAYLVSNSLNNWMPTLYKTIY